MTLETAQQIANFVNNWNNLQTYISYWQSWSNSSAVICQVLISDPNFSTILSSDQQSWIQNSQTFFSGVQAQMPAPPVLIPIIPPSIPEN